MRSLSSLKFITGLEFRHCFTLPLRKFKVTNLGEEDKVAARRAGNCTLSPSRRHYTIPAAGGLCVSDKAASGIPTLYIHLFQVIRQKCLHCIYGITFNLYFTIKHRT